MALKRRLTDQDYPFLRVIGRRTSRYAVKSVCVPDEEDNDCQSQTGSNDPVYDMILIDYDVEDDVESPVSHEDELKAIIPQLPATIETQKLQAQRQQQQKQEKNERQKRKQKQQEENAEWDAVWDYYEKQAQKKQKNQQRKQEQEEKQQNMTVIDYDEIESPVSQEDDMIEVGAEEIILEQERLIARKQRHQKQEKKQQMNDVWDEAWCNEY